MAIMYMLIGPTGCGKTTYRKANLSNLPCVSPDDFIVGKWTPEKARDAWDYAYKVAGRLLVNKDDFVVDAQFVNPGTRRTWLGLAKEFDYSVNAVVIDAPLKQILANHKTRGDRAGYGEVPKDVIHNSFKTFRNFCDMIENPVNVESRFDDIKIVVWGDQSTGWKKVKTKK